MKARQLYWQDSGHCHTNVRKVSSPISSCSSDHSTQVTAQRVFLPKTQRTVRGLPRMGQTPSVGPGGCWSPR